MEYVLNLKIGGHVSLVVCPLDDYTAQRQAGSNISVTLEGTTGRPVVKPDGYYVFTDLRDNEYRVLVRSDVYLDESIPIVLKQLDSSDKTLFLTLKPSAWYPFPGKANLIRVSLCDSEGNPARGAEIKGIVLSDSCASAKLAGLSEKKDEIYLMNVTGRIGIGDILLIKNKDGQHLGYCRIAGRLDAGHRYKLYEPLGFECRRGALMMPVVQTRADDRGECVVYFRSLRSRSCDVKLEFTYNEKVAERQVSMEEGKTHYLGTVQL